MRRLSLFVLLFAAASALAQSHGRAIMPARPDLGGDTVSGVVSSVSGSLVSLAGGLVTIDTAGAKVSGTIAPGALLVAVLQPGTVAPNAPLPAAFVGVTPLAQVTLTGSVTAVDLTHSTLTMFGRTIKVTPQTAISTTFPTFKAPTLSDVVPDSLVLVEANASGGALVAGSIRILSMHHSLLPTVVRGTVKSIGNDSWVIVAGGGKEVTVSVNASTKIVGDPKVGDAVQVIVGLDNLAVLIMKDPSGGGKP